jgi:hypothetical protein
LRLLDTALERAAFGAVFSLADPEARNSAALPLFEFQTASGGAWCLAARMNGVVRNLVFAVFPDAFFLGLERVFQRTHKIDYLAALGRLRSSDFLAGRFLCRYLQNLFAIRILEFVWFKLVLRKVTNQPLSTLEFSRSYCGFNAVFDLL